MEVRKHNARKITETFEYEARMELDVKDLNLKVNGEQQEGFPLSEAKLRMVRMGKVLKEFKIAGEDGKISLTFDERDKQQVVDLLRAMADALALEPEMFIWKEDKS